MMYLVLVLALCFGCASSTIHHNGDTYTAFSFGASHASAGYCDRVASDVTVSTKDTENRTTRDDERGTLCALANGGHGSAGLYATIAAGFSALVLLFGGVL